MNIKGRYSSNPPTIFVEDHINPYGGGGVPSWLRFRPIAPVGREDASVPRGPLGIPHRTAVDLKAQRWLPTESYTAGIRSSLCLADGRTAYRLQDSLGDVDAFDLIVENVE